MLGENQRYSVLQGFNDTRQGLKADGALLHELFKSRARQVAEGQVALLQPAETAPAAPPASWAPRSLPLSLLVQAPTLSHR